MEPNLSPPIRHADDTAHWVATALSGSQLGYTRLYQRHLPLVHVILLGRYPRALADELSQECFVRAFENLAKLQQPSQFGPWIATIARRMRAERSFAHTPETRLCEITDAGASPLEQAQAHELLKVIGTLPEAFSEPLLLRLVQGLDGAEIAQVLGMTAGSVRVNLHRGMRRLREALGLVNEKEQA